MIQYDNDIYGTSPHSKNSQPNETQQKSCLHLKGHGLLLALSLSSETCRSKGQSLVAFTAPSKRPLVKYWICSLKETPGNVLATVSKLFEVERPPRRKQTICEHVQLKSKKEQHLAG